MKHSILSVALLCALSVPAFAGDSETADYADALDAAWRFLDGSSMEEVCTVAVGLYIPRANEKKSGYIEKCAKETEARKEKFLADIETGKVEPRSCHEWAIASGNAWLSAQVNMGYNPMLTMEQGAVRFEGELKSFKNGEKDVLYVMSNGVKMALDMDYDPLMFDKEKLLLGSSVIGYAEKDSAIDVKLINGETTTISMGKVFCVEHSELRFK